MNEPQTDFRRVVEFRRRHGAGDILRCLGQLAGDELDVVGRVIERLSLGQGIYGQWVASADLRDLEREALDEELDDVVYRAMRTLKKVGAR